MLGRLLDDPQSCEEDVADEEGSEGHGCDSVGCRGSTEERKRVR